MCGHTGTVAKVCPLWFAQCTDNPEFSVVGLQGAVVRCDTPWLSRFDCSGSYARKMLGGVANQTLTIDNCLYTCRSNARCHPNSGAGVPSPPTPVPTEGADMADCHTTSKDFSDAWCLQVKCAAEYSEQCSMTYPPSPEVPSVSPSARHP